MKLLAVLTSLSVLCSALPLAAQTGFVTPILHDLETKEGPGFAYWLGSRQNQIQQVIDADFRGKARTINGILLRRDSTAVPSLATNLGRSFSNVTIRMSNANHDSVTTNFSKNMTSTPTTVWSGAYSMPTFTKAPPVLNPAPWGGGKNEFRFNFAKNFSYGGKTDFLTEWTLTNGKLANGGSWPTFAVPYYLDGGLASTASIRLTARYIPATRGSCSDSANTFAVGAYIFSSGMVDGPSGNLPARVTLNNYTGYTAPNSTVVHAIGLAWFNGVDFNAKCNRLYVAAHYPYVLRFHKTTNYGISGYQAFTLPWDSAFTDLSVGVQGVWTDSKTKQIGLTQAAVVRLPKNSPLIRLPRRKSVSEFGAGSSYQRILQSNDANVTPAHFYMTK